MEHSDHVKHLGESIQAYFREKDNDERLAYLSWDRLTNEQREWWFSCAQYVVDRE